MRAKSKMPSPGDNHFMPQFTETKCHGIDRPGKTPYGYSYNVPVECLQAALDTIEGMTRVHLNSTGLSSGHYVAKNASVLPKSAATWPLKQAYSSHVSYKAFAPTDAHNACCLFKRDIELYRWSCLQPLLRNCETCVAECKSLLCWLSSACGKT